MVDLFLAPLCRLLENILQIGLEVGRVGEIAGKAGDLRGRKGGVVGAQRGELGLELGRVGAADCDVGAVREGHVGDGVADAGCAAEDEDVCTLKAVRVGHADYQENQMFKEGEKKLIAVEAEDRSVPKIAYNFETG